MDSQIEYVSEAVVRWASDRFGGPVELAGPVTSKGEGFDSAVYLMQLSGRCLPEEWARPLVLRVKAEADREPEAAHEAAVQAWLADRGYPAPRVLEVFAPGDLLDRPAQVMERAPGSLMIDAARSAPWRIRRLCEQLADVHARLHAMPVDGFPPSDDLLDRRLRLPRKVADTLGDQQLLRALDRVAALSDALVDSPAVVCHGDFHPLNVLVSGDEVTVIDWTDAGVGDRHGDIARTLLLFELAAIAANSAAERSVLRLVGPQLSRLYRRSYERVATIDPRRIRLWTPVHLLHGWSQARALHAGLFDRDDPGDDRTDRIRPSLVAELEGRFDAAMAEVS